MTRTAIHLLSLAFACLLVGQARADSPWVVERTELHRDDGHGATGPLVSYFFPEDRTHHVTFHFKSLKYGVFSPKIVFTAVDTEAGANQKIIETEAAKSMIVNQIHGQVKLPRDFPLGVYRCQALVNGQVVATVDYGVLTRPDRMKILGHSLHVIDAKGEVGPKVERFAAANRHVLVKLRTTGVAPGTKATWVWNSVKTTAGANIRITDATMAVEAPGAFSLQSDFSLPSDLPVGTYRVDLLLAGKPAASVPFVVVPK